MISLGEIKTYKIDSNMQKVQQPLTLLPIL